MYAISYANESKEVELALLIDILNQTSVKKF